MTKDEKREVVIWKEDNMGIFDLFKKKEPAPEPITVRSELKVVEVEVKQRTPGEMPLADVGGYVSPSGGFVNFGRFRVSGVNGSTGRKNTKRYEVQDEAAARAAAVADGLVEPLTVEIEQQVEPTERQMDYALELEAMIPEGACKDDLSAIISRIVDEDEAAPDPGLSRYAHAAGVKFSRFVGAEALLGYMVSQMKGPQIGELYAYAVYLQENGGRMTDPRLLPVYDRLTACGECLAADPALLKSLEGREVNDFRGPNRGTRVYKAAADFLKQQKVL